MMRSDISTMDKETAIKRYGVSAGIHSLQDVLDTFFLLGYDIEMGLWGHSWWPVDEDIKEHEEVWWALLGNPNGYYASGQDGDVWWSFGGIYL